MFDFEIFSYLCPRIKKNKIINHNGRLSLEQLFLRVRVGKLVMNLSYAWLD